VRGRPRRHVLAFHLADVGPTADARVGRAPAVEAPWGCPLRSLEAALEKGNGSSANRAWQEGYAAALASGGWEEYLAMGDAIRRIANATGSRSLGEARWRSLYLAALFRARQQGAVAGVLRAAEAFADLGEGEIVEECLVVARGLAARVGDREAALRLQALTGQVAAN
jgi:hypothetical protein